jgi:hypothetical protein
MSGTEEHLLARARDLEDTDDLAGQCLTVLGRGRAAGVITEPLQGLATAAIALGAGQMAVYRAGTAARGYRRDTDFIDGLTEAEDDTDRHLADVAQLRAEILAALASAQAALAAAHAMPARTPAEHSAKAAAIAAAEQRIATCHDALGVVDQAARRLRFALRQLRRVPLDLGDSYEGLYDHLRAGKPLANDPDFHTPDLAHRAD